MLQLENDNSSLWSYYTLIDATDINTNETEYQFPKELLTVYGNGNSNITGNSCYSIRFKFLKSS